MFISKHQRTNQRPALRHVHMRIESWQAYCVLQVKKELPAVPLTTLVYLNWNVCWHDHFAVPKCLFLSCHYTVYLRCRPPAPFWSTHLKIFSLSKYTSHIQVLPSTLFYFFFSISCNVVLLTDKPSQLTVTWNTVDNPKSSIVEYGFHEESLNLSATGNILEFVDGGKAKRKQYIHKIKLANLSPGKKYCNIWMFFKASVS